MCVRRARVDASAGYCKKPRATCPFHVHGSFWVRLAKRDTPHCAFPAVINDEARLDQLRLALRKPVPTKDDDGDAMSTADPNDVEARLAIAVRQFDATALTLENVRAGLRCVAAAHAT